LSGDGEGSVELHRGLGIAVGGEAMEGVEHSSSAAPAPTATTPPLTLAKPEGPPAGGFPSAAQVEAAAGS